MKKSLAATLLVALAVFAAPALAASGKSVTVKVGDDYFVRQGKPSTITVKAGTSVRWRWTGHAPHDVTVTSGPQKFRSGSAQMRCTFTKKLTKRGTYKVLCTIHAPDMAMVIKVK